MKIKFILIALCIVMMIIQIGCDDSRNKENKTMNNELIINKWISSYNKHNIDELIELYDEQAINTQYPWNRSINGKDAIRKVYENTFAAFPDIHLTKLEILKNDKYIGIQWEFTGTMKGKFAGKDPNGNKFDLKGFELFKIENGKILEQHGYWDKSTMFDQLLLNK